MSFSLRCDISALHSVRFQTAVCETEDLLWGALPVPTNAPSCMVHVHHNALDWTGLHEQDTVQPHAQNRTSHELCHSAGEPMCIVHFMCTCISTVPQRPLPAYVCVFYCSMLSSTFRQLWEHIALEVGLYARLDATRPVTVLVWLL